MIRFNDSERARVRRQMLGAKVGATGWQPKSSIQREQLATKACKVIQRFEAERPGATAKEVRQAVRKELSAPVGFGLSTLMLLYYIARLALLAYQWWKARQDNQLESLWK